MYVCLFSNTIIRVQATPHKLHNNYIKWPQFLSPQHTHSPHKILCLLLFFSIMDPTASDLPVGDVGLTTTAAKESQIILHYVDLGQIDDESLAETGAETGDKQIISKMSRDDLEDAYLRQKEVTLALMPIGFKWLSLIYIAYFYYQINHLSNID